MANEDKGMTKYPANALEHFRDGALTDFRLRLAMQLLAGSPRYALVKPSDGEYGGICSPDWVARDALDVAAEMVKLAEARGLIEPIPDDGGELTAAMRAQARRTASYQIAQQREAQRFAQSEQDRVIPQAPGFAGRMNS